MNKESTDKLLFNMSERHEKRLLANASIELKYDPCREIMIEMKEQLTKLLAAIEIHDSVVKSITNKRQPAAYEHHLQRIVESCDEILYESVDSFCEWRAISKT